MRKPLLLSLLVALVAAGCFNPSVPDKVGARPKKSTGVGVASSPKSSPLNHGEDLGEPGADGGSAYADESAAPGGGGTVPGTGIEGQPSLAPGEFAFTIEDEPPYTWLTGPSLNRARVGAAAGRVGADLIVAEGDHRPSYEIFDLARGTWSLDDSYDVENHGEEGLTLHKGLFFAAGGSTGTELWAAGGENGDTTADNASGRTEIYLYTAEHGFGNRRKADEGTFSLAKGMRAAASGIAGDVLIVAGGQHADASVSGDVQLVDLGKPGADAKAGTPMPVPVAGAASTVVQGKLVVMGGYTFSGGRETPVDVMQIYDPAADTWTKSGDGGLPHLNVPLSGAAAAYVAGTLFLGGGVDAAGNVQSKLYATDTKTYKPWIEVSLLPTARALYSLVAYRTALWAIGGVGADHRPLRSVDLFFTGANAE